MNPRTDILSSQYNSQFTLFCQSVGSNEADPLVRLALESWISFFQEVCLQWLEHRDIPREQILVLLEQSLSSDSFQYRAADTSN